MNGAYPNGGKIQQPLPDEAALLYTLVPNQPDLNKKLLHAVLYDTPVAFNQSETAFLLLVSHQRICKIEEGALGKVAEQLRDHELKDEILGAFLPKEE